MTTTKQYDYLNRLTFTGSTPASGVGNGAPPLPSFSYVYNQANQRIAATNTDNTHWLYQYDSLGQVISGKRYWSDGTPVAGQQFEYGFDDIGNRQQTGSGGDAFGVNLRTASYTANNLNQYTSRDVPGYATVLGSANPNATVTVNLQRAYRYGNYFSDELSADNSSAALWLSLTNLAVLNNGIPPSGTDIVATNIGNVFLPQTPEMFGYDVDGNMTNDGRWAYTWDAENRLTQVESLAGTPIASKRKVTWEYDGKGRRVRQTTYDGSSGNYIVTEDLKFVSDGWRHIAELNATNNALVRSYVWGLDLSGSMDGAGGVGGLLMLNSVANGTHFCAYDGNGNVVALIKAADGTVSANYEYEAFGKTIRATGFMARENPFRFSTKRTDNTTDLVLFEMRPYIPSLGRWPNRDPLDEEGGLNLFTFCANQPIGHTDALGAYISMWHTSGRSYQLAAVDADLWNTIINYADSKGYSLTLTAMSHADGTLPGDWILNNNEIEKVKATKTYKDYLEKLKQELRSVSPGQYGWESKKVNMNFKTLDGKTDPYNAFGDARFSSYGDICASRYSVAYRPKITMTDYYSFLHHGYNRVAWYTPTSIGWRLESNAFLNAFSVSGEWNENTIVVFK